MCTEVEAWANNCENKASVWKNLKNSFVWYSWFFDSLVIFRAALEIKEISLMGMKKLIFDYNNFFGLGHFLIHDILENRPKNDRNQKVIGSKNYCSHAC